LEVNAARGWTTSGRQQTTIPRPHGKTVTRGARLPGAVLSARVWKESPPPEGCTQDSWRTVAGSSDCVSLFALQANPRRRLGNRRLEAPCDSYSRPSALPIGRTAPRLGRQRRRPLCTPTILPFPGQISRARRVSTPPLCPLPERQLGGLDRSPQRRTSETAERLSSPTHRLHSRGRGHGLPVRGGILTWGSEGERGARRRCGPTLSLHRTLPPDESRHLGRPDPS